MRSDAERVCGVGGRDGRDVMSGDATWSDGGALCTDTGDR